MVSVGSLIAMRWLKWIPWQPVAARAARAQGFIDPIQFLRRLRAFARPSEVSEPIELLRAGVAFHARGLINTKAFQFNLDWIWPYWVERQFSPADESFVPRAFSFSHINLTHRNWTAIGLPGLAHYPIIDPRGLVTPHFDGWSLDFWIVNPDGTALFPSKTEHAEQMIELGEKFLVKTQTRQGAQTLQTLARVELVDGVPHCLVDVECSASAGARLAVVARPYNPEGVSFIDSISTVEGGGLWTING